MNKPSAQSVHLTNTKKPNFSEDCTNHLAILIFKTNNFQNEWKQINKKKIKNFFEI